MSEPMPPQLCVELFSHSPVRTPVKRGQSPIQLGPPLAEGVSLVRQCDPAV